MNGVCGYPVIQACICDSGSCKDVDQSGTPLPEGAAMVEDFDSIPFEDCDPISSASKPSTPYVDYIFEAIKRKIGTCTAPSWHLYCLQKPFTLFWGLLSQDLPNPNLVVACPRQEIHSNLVIQTLMHFAF